MKLAESHGRVLIGRATAAHIVERVSAEIARGSTVVLDFAGVKAVSPSFADELFGKLTRRADAARVRFVNLSNHLEMVARMAEQHRRTTDDQANPS